MIGMQAKPFSTRFRIWHPVFRIDSEFVQKYENRPVKCKNRDGTERDLSWPFSTLVLCHWHVGLSPFHMWVGQAFSSRLDHVDLYRLTYMYSIFIPTLFVAPTYIFAFLYLLFLKHIRFPPDFIIWFVSSQLRVGLFRFGMNSGPGDF